MKVKFIFTRIAVLAIMLIYLFTITAYGATGTIIQIGEPVQTNITIQFNKSVQEPSTDPVYYQSPGPISSADILSGNNKMKIMLPHLGPLDKDNVKYTIDVKLPGINLNNDKKPAEPSSGEKETDIEPNAQPDATPPVVTLNTAEAITLANVNNYSISGSVNEPNSKVNICLFNSGIRAEYYTDADKDGKFSADCSAKSLNDGPVILAVNAKDTAGNISDAVERTINKWTELKVTLDKTVISVGEDSEINMTVTAPDGTAVPATIPIIMFDGGVVRTGNIVNGKYKTTIHPKSSGSIPIIVNRKAYRSLLYAVDKDEVLAQLTITNTTNMNLCDADIVTKSIAADDKLYGISRWYVDNGKVFTSCIVHKGANRLQITGRDYNNNFYYIVEDFNTTPGIINNISIDVRDTKSITFNAKVNSNGLDTPLDYECIYLQKDDVVFKQQYVSAFSKDNGRLTVYATPGSYKVSVEDIENDKVSHLIKNNIVIDHDGSYDITWDKDELMTINMNILNDIGQNALKSIMLNSELVSMGKQNQLIINRDNYTVKEIILSPDDGTKGEYIYGKSTVNEDIISINSSSYTTDLRIKTVQVTIGTLSQNPNSNGVPFINTQLITYSGYTLMLLTNNDCYMDITVTDPNGVVSHNHLIYMGGSSGIEINGLEGLYTVTVDMHLGAISVPGNPITVTFYYKSNADGDVDSNGILDDRDASILKEVILREISLIPQINAAADVDGDGKITSADYALIRKKIKNMIDKFPVEK